MNKQVRIMDLKPGDLILCKWYDASINRGRLPEVPAAYDNPIWAIGYFLGVKGHKRQHLILGKSKLVDPGEWEADRIPVELVEYVVLIESQHLQRLFPNIREELKKYPIHIPKSGWHKRVAKVRWV
jgi:hypothetical protein